MLTTFKMGFDIDILAFFELATVLAKIGSFFTNNLITLPTSVTKKKK